MASLEDIDKKREAEKKQILKQRGKSVNVGGNTLTEGTRIQLTTGENVLMKRAGLGNPAKPMMHVVYDDGRKATISMTFREKGVGGAPTTDIKDTSQTEKRPANRFLNKQNTESNQVAKDTKDGKIKTLADLKNHPSYKSTSSGVIKNKLVRAFKKAGGDTSYKPVEKKVELPKPEPKQISVKDKYEQQIKDQKSMSPQRYYQVYKQPLTATVTKPRSTVDRAAASAASGARNVIRGKGGFGRNTLKRFASGGLVNASNGAFVEVQNRFSDRMLPGKKRTTRIY